MRRRRLPLSFLCLALAGAAAADAAGYEGKPIASIQFEPPRQPLNPEDLRAILPLTEKQPFRIAEVRTAIKRLYATGHYRDIQVDASEADGGVALRFLTRSSWFMGRVHVDGAPPEPPNAGQLVNAANLELGAPFDEDAVEQGAAAMRQLLESNGYYTSTVAPRLEYEGARQQVHVYFTISAGKRARFEAPVVNGAADPAKVAHSTSWKGWLGWKPLTQARVQRGVERIRAHYGKTQQLLATVSVDSLAFDAEKGRVKPELTVSPGPRITVRGIGAKVSRGKLKRYIPIYEERTVDRDLLAEGARNLRDYFQSEGYFEAEVVFKEQRVRDEKAFLDFLINPGPRHRLVHLGVQGNRFFDGETLRERMAVTPRTFALRTGRYSESLLRRDEENIAELYRSNGFRDVKVSSKVVDDYRGRRGDLAALLTVEEGPQWFVSKLEVEGVPEERKPAILALLASGEGQPFSEANVAVDRDNVLAYFFAGGRPNGAFEWSFVAETGPDALPHRVRLRYAVSEGPRQFVRDILIGGLKTTRPKLIDHNLLIAPGDPLSQIRMAETQRRLYDLGVFAKVNMAIQNPEGETERKYLLYEMEEARRYSIATGFGAEIARIGGCRTCFDSPAGKAGFSPRVSFDASRLNLQGLGHTLSFRSRLSTLQRRALVSYTAPRIRDRQGLNLTFTTLYDDSRDVRTFSARRAEASVQLSQRLSKPTTAFYRFSYRRVSLSSLNINPLLIPLLAQPVRLGILSGSLIQDRRDSPTDSHKGVYNTLDAGIATSIFGSQANFVRLLARNNTYHPIGKKAVLARTSSIGWLHAYRYSPSLASTAGVPLPERFFSGGATSHRGFPENQAGQRDLTTGFPLGGNALLLNSVELRFPLWGERIGGVLFEDAGNAYSRIQDLSLRLRQKDIRDFNYLVHAVGFGVRYRTPVGPLRLDLSYVPNSPRFHGFQGTRDDLLFGRGTPTDQRIGRFQFHFSIGQAF